MSTDYAVESMGRVGLLNLVSESRLLKVKEFELSPELEQEGGVSRIARTSRLRDSTGWL